MSLLLGIRREDKNKWEGRVPLIPEHIKTLIDQHNIKVFVQPSPIRAIKEKDFIDSGAEIKEDLSDCKVVFAVKEIPKDFYKKDTVYVFFSHTIKGQSYNMPKLQKLMDLGCTLIDYEKIADENRRRLVFFGKYAGLAGMIDSLWAIGQRLKAEGVETPLSNIKKAYEYKDLEDAKNCISKIGQTISKKGLPESVCPFIYGFSGYGNVSKGAQEVYDVLPAEKISPEKLEKLIKNGSYSNKKFYKVVFKEEHLVAPKEKLEKFNLKDYFENPEKYQGIFEKYLPNLTMLINAIYWEEKYPRLVTKESLLKLFNNSNPLKLKVIGDISCDIEGSVEVTLKTTDPENPVFLYNPLKDTVTDGYKGDGIVVLAVDILPSELPIGASRFFSDALKDFVPSILKADYNSSFENCELPKAIKKAVIVYKGELTQDFKYLKKFLKK